MKPLNDFRPPRVDREDHDIGVKAEHGDQSNEISSSSMDGPVFGQAFGQEGPGAGGDQLRAPRGDVERRFLQRLEDDFVADSADPHLLAWQAEFFRQAYGLAAPMHENLRCHGHRWSQTPGMISIIGRYHFASEISAKPEEWPGSRVTRLAPRLAPAWRRSSPSPSWRPGKPAPDLGGSPSAPSVDSCLCLSG